MNTPENDPTQAIRLTPISQAATYAEIGEFWDTHCGADYWDQMVEVEMTIDPAVRRKFRDGVRVMEDFMLEPNDFATPPTGSTSRRNGSASR